MSFNDPKYQEAYELLAQQLKLRPENVVANLNHLLEETQFQLKLLTADPLKHFEAERSPQQQFPFATGQGVKKLYADDFPYY